MAKEDKQDKKRESKEQILEQTKNRLLREKANSLFNSAFEAREHYDWEWLTRDLFRRGYQFSTYDNRSKTVLLATRRGVKFPVNLLWAQMKAIRNQVTNFQPKWEVLPVSNSEDAITNARYSGRLLDYYYRRLGLRKTIKETVMQGLLFSVGGPWQIGYDADADGGRGEAYCWLLDTYDFYIDPNATSLPEAEYCVKAMRKNLAEITSNPKYQFYGPIPERGESRVAASYSKQFLLQTLRAKVGTAVEEEEEGAILKEVWIKIRVSKENKEELTKELAKNEQETKDLRTGEVLMRIVHYVDFLDDPLLVQLKRTNEFPFVLYSADISPCEIYGESWAKHIIPVNRVLNALESSVFTYNYRYAIGRIVVDKNSGVRLISNQHGDFIEKNRGSEVTSMPLQSLPSSYQYQIDNCRKYIEDLGGAHEPSRGIVPTGVTSGIAIAELKQADASNSSDLVDNLEDFLVEVGKKILKVIAENYDIPKIIKDLGLGGDVKHFAIIGEKSAKSRKNTKEVRIGVDTFKLAVIGSDNEIRVTVGSWLAYTKDARQEKIKELFNSGLIDQKTALQHMEFSDIDTIVEDVRKEEILKKFRGSIAQGAKEEVSDEEIARQENLMMTKEKREIEPLVTDNHTIHNIVHQEALGISGNELVEKHMSLHNALIEKYGPGGQQETPEEVVAGREQLAGVPAEGATTPMSAPPSPQGLPAGTQVPPGPQAPQSPEETALAQSLAEAGMGGM